MHNINILKPVCESSVAGARLKEADPLAKLSPTELKDPTRPSHSHHDFGANDDTVHGSFPSQSHPSSQIAIDSKIFSPAPGHADAAATSTPPILGHETCQILDQERCSSSDSSILNLSSHGEAVSNTTPSSLGDESCQFFDQERCTSSYSSLNLADTSSFRPIDDTTQMPLDAHKQCAPIVFSPSNVNEIVADDRIMSTPYVWTDLPMDLFQPATSSTHGGSNEAADCPMDLLQPETSSTNGGPNATADLPMDILQPATFSTNDWSNTTPQDGIENLILSNNDFMPSPSHPSPQSRAGHEPQKNVRLGTKRMKKLDTLLEMLQTTSLLDVTEHNDIVNETRQLCQKRPFHHRRQASESFSANAEEPTASSSAAKFASNLLSWEKYRQEERRLIRDEDLSSISASKEVNARMMKARRIHSKTRDWASDGRKAAKMFFDALHNRSTADRSFALLLLASNVSLDQMLKIAHFPALRSSFASRFARVVEQKAELWSTMSGIGFAVLNVDQVVGH